MAKKTKKEVNTEIINEEIIDITNVESNKETTGLGDVIENVTNFLGVKKCSDCEQRRKKLNKMFPFTKKAKRELTDIEINFIESVGTKLNQEDRLMLGSLYEALYGGKVRHCTSCPGVYKNIIGKLKMQIEYQRIV